MLYGSQVGTSQLFHLTNTFPLLLRMIFSISNRSFLLCFANFNRFSCIGGKFFTGESLTSSDKMYVCIGLNLCVLFI